MKEPSSTHPGLRTWLILGRAYETFARISREHIESLGLGGVKDFAVLEALLHKGPLPVNTLGRIVFLTSGSMTTAVDRLEKRGLVQRQPDPEDRRVIRVALTEAGREKIIPAFREHAEVMSRAFSGLTREEHRTLAGLLKKAGKAAH